MSDSQNNPLHSMKSLRYRSPWARTSNSAQSDWMMNVDDVTSSTVEGMEDYMPIINYIDLLERNISAGTSTPMSNSADCKSGPVLVHFRDRIATVSFEILLFSGQVVDKIIISRRSQVGEAKVLESITYTLCLISIVRSENDDTFLEFFPKSREREATAINQDGSEDGNVISTFDFTTNS